MPGALESSVLRASLELKESKQRLEGLARRTGVARSSGWLPDITVDVHVLHGERDSEGAPAREDGTRVGAGVSFTLPLFDRNQGTAAAFEAEFDALLERYYGLAVELRSLARDAASRVVSSHARSRQYEDVILPAQRRVSQETLLQYNAMQVGVFQLLQARREELGAELAYVDTLREYWSAAAELSALLAGSRVSAGGSPKASSIMTQMGHGLPHLIGADTSRLDRRMSRVVPAYMTMGAQGMGNMGEMGMAIPPNSLPMRGTPGPFSYIDMGGMFTVLKVRDEPDSADPAGWYEHPEGTVAGPADAQRMRGVGLLWGEGSSWVRVGERDSGADSGAGAGAGAGFGSGIRERGSGAGSE